MTKDFSLKASVLQSSPQGEPCAQLKCGETLKFPFARDTYSPVTVSILDAKELVSADVITDTKRVVELTLDISALGGLNYDPGDTVAILPSNATEVVAHLLQRLDLTQHADNTCHVRLATNCTKRTPKCLLIYRHPRLHVRS